MWRTLYVDSISWLCRNRCRPPTHTLWQRWKKSGIRIAPLVWLLLGQVMLSGSHCAAEEKELFADTFQHALAEPWKTIGGSWQIQDGVLKQMDAELDDPSKAVLVIGDAEEMSSGILVTAKFRLDKWTGDDQARAGIGLVLRSREWPRVESCAEPGTTPVPPRLCHLGARLCVPLPDRHLVLDETLQDPRLRCVGKPGATVSPSRPIGWSRGQGSTKSLTGYPALLGASGGPGVAGRRSLLPSAASCASALDRPRFTRRDPPGRKR